jgi:hypothetical protein
MKNYEKYEKLGKLMKNHKKLCKTMKNYEKLYEIKHL